MYGVDERAVDVAVPIFERVDVVEWVWLVSLRCLPGEAITVSDMASIG
jgi:hypothetical protein